MGISSIGSHLTPDIFFAHRLCRALVGLEGWCVEGDGSPRKGIRMYFFFFALHHFAYLQKWLQWHAFFLFHPFSLVLFLLLRALGGGKGGDRKRGWGSRKRSFSLTPPERRQAIGKMGIRLRPSLVTRFWASGRGSGWMPPIRQRKTVKGDIAPPGSTGVDEREERKFMGKWKMLFFLFRRTLECFRIHLLEMPVVGMKRGNGNQRRVCHGGRRG